MQDNNVDLQVVEGFGKEWSAYDQSGVESAESAAQFNRYFSIFPWDKISKESTGADFGCGSGRWAKLIAHKIKKLYCIDASAEALTVARKNLNTNNNCEFICSSVELVNIADGSLDFAYSLGVLHHVPDTQAALVACVRKLKSGAPFLLYLYYAFDNRPFWYRGLWYITDIFRRLVSRAPFRIKYIITNLIALIIYYPLARLSLLAGKLGMNVEQLPLSAYRGASFYTMRTDALDRFGTRLEQRFTRKQIEIMLLAAGLTDIRFSEEVPYWCAVGTKVQLHTK